MQQLIAANGGPSLNLSWTTIAIAFSMKFTERSGKQCRERYANHLHPDLRKGAWTKEEDDLIMALQSELGNQWAKMVQFLPGRSDNSIKNRFWSFYRSRRRKHQKTEKIVEAVQKTDAHVRAQAQAQAQAQVEAQAQAQAQAAQAQAAQVQAQAHAHAQLQLIQQMSQNINANKTGSYLPSSSPYYSASTPNPMMSWPPYHQQPPQQMMYGNYPGYPPYIMGNGATRAAHSQAAVHPPTTALSAASLDNNPYNPSSKRQKLDTSPPSPTLTPSSSSNSSPPVPTVPIKSEYQGANFGQLGQVGRVHQGQPGVVPNPYYNLPYNGSANPYGYHPPNWGAMQQNGMSMQPGSIGMQPGGINMPPGGVMQSSAGVGVQPGMRVNVQPGAGVAAAMQSGMMRNVQPGDVGSSIQPGAGVAAAMQSAGMMRNVQPGGVGGNGQPGTEVAAAMQSAGMMRNVQPGGGVAVVPPIMGGNVQPGGGAGVQPDIGAGMQQPALGDGIQPRAGVAMPPGIEPRVQPEAVVAAGLAVQPGAGGDIQPGGAVAVMQQPQKVASAGVLASAVSPNGAYAAAGVVRGAAADYSSSPLADVQSNGGEENGDGEPPVAAEKKDVAAPLLDATKRVPLLDATKRVPNGEEFSESSQVNVSDNDSNSESKADPDHSISNSNGDCIEQESDINGSTSVRVKLEK